MLSTKQSLQEAMATSSSNAPKIVVGDYFSREIRVLKLIGVSLSGNEGIPYRIYSFSMLFLTGVLYPLVDMYELTKMDFNGAAELVNNIACIISGFVKMMLVLRNRKKFRQLLAKIQREPFTANPKRGGEAEAKILGECFRITNAQSLIYWCILYTSFVMILIYPMISRIRSSDYHDWKFSYGPLTVLNVTYSPNYEITWLWQNITTFYMGSGFTGTDLLLNGVLAHITYQFKILQNSFKVLVEISHKEMIKDSTTSALSESTSSSVNVPWKYLKKSLTTAVCYHQAIIDLVRDVEEIFNILQLSLFLAALGQLCLVIYNGSLQDNNMQLAINIAYSFIICFQLLLVCYWGERVLEESQMVGRAAFDADFVGTDLRYQKALVVVIRRSQRPCKLTAGKFSVIGLATFTWILRTSYSAFAVLRSTSK